MDKVDARALTIPLALPLDYMPRSHHDTPGCADHQGQRLMDCVYPHQVRRWV